MMKTIESNRRLRVRFRLLLFYSELAHLDPCVTCSRLYSDGKNVRKQCHMNTLMVTSINILNFVELFLTFVLGDIQERLLLFIGQMKIRYYIMGKR